MHLSIAIPEAQVVEAPALLRIVRMAPACDVEADEQGASYVALFDDFPKSVEIVARLIEEAWDLHDVHITLEGRPIVSRINFYAALRCYHESLGAPDAEAYCLQQAASGTEDVRLDRASPTVSLSVRVVWVSRAIRARVSFDSALGHGAPGWKWTGVRTSASREWMCEPSSAGYSEPR